jgi:S-adenosylmethionine:tRNA ribosyltransferase-isomerase
MLVSAYKGREEILKAYKKAVTMEYNFYSFGDAMLIFREDYV